MLWFIFILIQGIMLIGIIKGYFDCTWSDLKILVAGTIGTAMSLVTIFILPNPQVSEVNILYNAAAMGALIMQKYLYMLFVISVLFVLPRGVKELKEAMQFQPIDKRLKKDNHEPLENR